MKFLADMGISPRTVAYLRERAHEAIRLDALGMERATDSTVVADRRRIRGRGKWRHIDNPQGELKKIQGLIQHRILSGIALPSAMTGCVPGRSIKDNAVCHCDRPVVVTLDLRNCFPRTNDRRVFDALRNVVGCSDEIASLLLKLTTLHHRLPQGAPTSGTLANLALIPLHDEIARIATALELAWSFYVDNITFSGFRATEAIAPIAEIIGRYGYSVHDVRAMPRSKRQWITGAVVNRKPSAGHHRIQEIRESILDLATRKEIQQYALTRVRSQIAHVRFISPIQGATLTRMAERYLPLTGSGGRGPRSDEIRPCKGFRSQSHDAE